MFTHYDKVIWIPTETCESAVQLMKWLDSNVPNHVRASNEHTINLKKKLLKKNDLNLIIKDARHVLVIMTDPCDSLTCTGPASSRSKGSAPWLTNSSSEH